MRHGRSHTLAPARRLGRAKYLEAWMTSNTPGLSAVVLPPPPPRQSAELGQAASLNNPQRHFGPCEAKACDAHHGGRGVTRCHGPLSASQESPIPRERRLRVLTVGWRNWSRPFTPFLSIVPGVLLAASCCWLLTPGLPSSPSSAGFVYQALQPHRPFCMSGPQTTGPGPPTRSSESRFAEAGFGYLLSIR